MEDRHLGGAGEYGPPAKMPKKGHKQMPMKGKMPPKGMPRKAAKGKCH